MNLIPGKSETHTKRQRCLEIVTYMKCTITYKFPWTPCLFTGGVTSMIVDRMSTHQPYRFALALIAGLMVWLALPSESVARPKKDLIYNECACRCVAPGDVVGVITDIKNTAGVSCGTYNSKTCNYADPATGGVRSGTLRDCGGFKPGGTKALQQAVPKLNSPIMRRGIEGEQPTEPSAESAK